MYYIYNNGLESVIEAAYLGEGVVGKTGKSNIEVNPRGSIGYIVGKLVILNNPFCPEDIIGELLKNGNKIISRVAGYGSKIPLHPYILRPNFSIMWNGETYSCPREVSGELRSFLEWFGGTDSFPIDSDSGIDLFLPKINGMQSPLVYDREGNLTALGWAMHQVGMNYGKVFKDMDILKTKKIIM